MKKRKIKERYFRIARKSTIGSRIVDRGVMTKRAFRNLLPKINKKIIDLQSWRESNELRGLKLTRSNDNYLVVIHLYYFESWNSISEKISRLKDFDLLITIPNKNKEYIPRILEEYESATIIVVPNRGRDVLAFTVLLNKINDAGYDYILKIHSKKSTHRKDGDEWFSDMLDKLIPNDRNVLDSIIYKLSETQTSIIGPAGHYVSLRVNFDQNKHYLQKYLIRMIGEKATRVIKHPDEYGFFAGTMFWARIESLGTITNQHIRLNEFDIENGQIDSTLAHAIERLYCVIPEFEKKYIYESDGLSIGRINYATNNIPDWSDVEIKTTKYKT